MGSSRGFTLVEATAVTAAAVIMGSLGAAMFEQPRADAQQRKDSTQIRGIHQAMVVWAQNNQDQYPLPSKIDLENATVAEEGRAKDISANIYSLLVYNGMIASEMLVSPLENNDSVEPLRKYEFDQPRKAVNPAKAKWDPRLKVALGARETGHVSYAHLQPAGGRLKAWSNSFSSSEVVLSTRGPQITKAVIDAKGILVPTLAKPDSKTLSQLGDGEAWSGHVVTNDNHVEFSRNMFAHEKFHRRTDFVYKNASKIEMTDVLFLDEQDDPKSSNRFLSLFVKAGEKPADYTAIWD